VILGNAVRLGIQLDTLDAIVLSHGHDDHTGGLADVLRAAGGPKVMLHPAALEAKYVRLEAPPHRAIGFPDTCRRALESDAREAEWTRKPTGILPGLEATGAIPRTALPEPYVRPMRRRPWRRSFARGTPSCYSRNVQAAKPERLAEDGSISKAGTSPRA
jgi:metal-dependent hydrolase (beta-lactamase superfamily II)